MATIGTSRFTSPPSIGAYTAAASRFGPLGPGTYRLVTSTDAFFLQGTLAVSATTTSHPIFAKVEIEVTVQGTGDNYISFVKSVDDGIAWVAQIR